MSCRDATKRQLVFDPFHSSSQKWDVTGLRLQQRGPEAKPNEPIDHSLWVVAISSPSHDADQLHAEDK